MGGTASQKEQLDEGDDVKQLIQCRSHVKRYQALVAKCHNDCRNKA